MRASIEDLLHQNFLLSLILQRNFNFRIPNFVFEFGKYFLLKWAYGIWFIHEIFGPCVLTSLALTILTRMHILLVIFTARINVKPVLFELHEIIHLVSKKGSERLESMNFRINSVYQLDDFNCLHVVVYHQDRPFVVNNATVVYLGAYVLTHLVISILLQNYVAVFI